MAFSSISFLFYFLPLFFLVYWLVPARWKNAILTAGSLPGAICAACRCWPSPFS